MNPLKKLLGQTAIYGLSSIVGRLLNYLLVPLYTRYFTTSEYGDVTLLYAYVAFLLIVLTYGMETAFFRFSQRHPNKSAVYSTSLISLLISSVVFVVLMFSNAQSIADFLSFSSKPEYVQYFALILGLDALSAISFAKLREQNRAVRFASIRLFNIFVNIGLNLFFIVYCPLALSNNLLGAEFIQTIYSEDIGIGYIFIANLVASVLTLLLFVPEMVKSTWRFDVALWRKMMIYALPLMLAGLAGITNETIDRILLKHLLPADISASEIGLYSAFYKLSIIMTLFVQTFRFAAEPFFFAQEKEQNAKEVYALVMKYFTIVTALIFLTVTIYYDIVKQFIGSDFHDDRGAIIVPILLLANLFLGLYYNLSVWYKLTEKTLFGAYMSLFGAGVTIVLNLLLIPKLGFVGSAWATLCCYLLMVLCSYFLGRKYYPIPYPLQRMGLYFVLMFALYFLSINWSLGMLNNTLYLLIFIAVAFVLERPKKSSLNI
ncbi:MAG: polysaccharide biosynthesis protein [Flavobacteriales bacterium]|nr:polysaccharide biosynthesis protein [Flavobacteriales bacterium]MBL6872727.1 polysaccharide biosynthesis protein [Flavobacteriales bacterium]